MIKQTLNNLKGRYNGNLYKEYFSIKNSFGEFTYTIPISRRYLSSTVGNDLVSVQPLSVPSGLLYYTDLQVCGSGVTSTLSTRYVGRTFTSTYDSAGLINITTI